MRTNTVRKPSQSRRCGLTIAAAIIMCLFLCLEVHSIIAKAHEYRPNRRSSSTNILRDDYFPRSPVPRSNEGGPLFDWWGVENLVAHCQLTPTQDREMRKIEDKAVLSSRRARALYNQLLDPLTPEQLRRLLLPQPTVADSQCLGIDCVEDDLQLLAIHSLYLLATAETSTLGATPAEPSTAGATASPNTATQSASATSKAASSETASAKPGSRSMRLSPTRLLYSMHKLCHDPDVPLTPAQARQILKTLSALSLQLTTVHECMGQATSLFTPDQLQRAKTLELRHAALYITPVALENLEKTIAQRHKGAPTK